ncbi:MAG: hypothetical protein SVX43_18550, partial [Cyanobacteriota bacterium]|nr:hypothetical protein [Cyanobacteriota bacterium]
ATRGGEDVEATTGNLREETDETQVSRAIRPAQGWVMAADGSVILTAEASTSSFAAPDRLTTPNCHVFQRSNR